jgi:hypothetical protein
MPLEKKNEPTKSSGLMVPVVFWLLARVNTANFGLFEMFKECKKNAAE